MARQALFLENDTTTQNARALRYVFERIFRGRAGTLAPDDLKVTQRGAGANMSVDVAAGGSINNGTEGSLPGDYLFYNDAVLNVAISASNPTNPRNDLVFARVRDSQYSGANNDADIIVVAGTPAGSPVDPDLDALGHENYFKLARVVVPAAASSIVNANITDLRTNTAASGGLITCTSTTRPTAVAGQTIFETNTGDMLVYNSLSAAWRILAQIIPYTNYTPTFSGAVIGSGGVVFGRYTRIGDTVFGASGFVLGSGGTVNAELMCTLPVNAAAPSIDSDFGWMGGAQMYDNSASTRYASVGLIKPSVDVTRIRAFATAGVGFWTSGVPVGWVVSDKFNCFFAYEAV